MLLYWLLFPLAFGAMTLGLGLGLRRLSVPFPAPLLLPAGYAAAIVISCALCVVPATTVLAGPAVIVLALAGYAFGYRDLVAPGGLRRQLPWIVVGLAGFVAFAFSSLVYGKPTFTGASMTVDIAHQFDFAWWVGTHGRESVEPGVSSAKNVVDGGLRLCPWGPQSLLGTFPRTIGLGIPESWQPMLAVLAANIVVAAYALLRLCTDSRWFAAAGAFAAGQASALIGYGQIGGIKELAAAGLLLTAASFTLLLRDEERPAWRTAVPIAVVAAGVFSIFSLTLVPWLLITLVGGLAVLWKSVSPRFALVHGAWALGIALVLSLPSISPALHSLDYAQQMGSADEVGNLDAPLSRWAVTGVWFAADHRFALHGGLLTLSIVVGLVVIALAAVGLVAAVRRRAFPILNIAAASLFTFVLLVVQMGPWVELKGIVLASPIVLLLAIGGLSVVLTRERLAYGAWAAAIGLVVAGVYSDTLRFGAIRLFAADRYAELGAVNERFSGMKGALHPDWDEQAEYQLRDVDGAAAFNTRFAQDPEFEAELQANGGATDTEWDLDRIDTTYLNQFPLVVPRRAVFVSRPPQNYSLVTQGDHYDVWRQTGPQALAHLGLRGTADAEGQKRCQAFLKQLPTGATATIAPSALAMPAFFDPAESPPSWRFIDNNAQMYPRDAGLAIGKVSVPKAGRYEVYLASNSLRKVTLRVGDQKLRDVPRERTWVLRPTYVDTVYVEAGDVSVELRQGGAGLLPGGGDAANREARLGPVVLVPEGGLHPKVIKGKAASLRCPVGPDWVETP